MSFRQCLWLGILSACSQTIDLQTGTTSTAGGATTSASAGTTGSGTTGSTGGSSVGSTTGQASGPVTGFIFDGPTDAGPLASGANYTLELAGDAGGGSAVIGSPCLSGNDCAALGPNAGCFRSPDGGFCTLDCSSSPEGVNVCPAGANCFIGLSTRRLCLSTCGADGGCFAPGLWCSGGLFSFSGGLGYNPVCLPLCRDNADCNNSSSELICDQVVHRCVNPYLQLGAGCATNADCGGLGLGGTCLRSTRNPDSGYCTEACLPDGGAPCGGEPLFNTPAGLCLSGYAVLPDGGGVDICVAVCSSDASCKANSGNTCNYVPVLAASACTIACRSNADCPAGVCDAATGDCQESGFFSPLCGSDSDCASGVCIQDGPSSGAGNCTNTCFSNAGCPEGAVCVVSVHASSLPWPDAGGDTNGGLVSWPDAGFCAPACAMDGGSCADPTTHCIAPVAVSSPDQVDHAGSGSASSDYCWR